MSLPPYYGTYPLENQTRAEYYKKLLGENNIPFDYDGINNYLEVKTDNPGPILTLLGFSWPQDVKYPNDLVYSNLVLVGRKTPYPDLPPGAMY